VNQVGANQSYIKVSFTNQTQHDVAFFLNGGTGLQTTLAAGKVQHYTMVVDAGVQPLVGIYQFTGPRLDFKVVNDGIYAFIVKEGKIVTSYGPTTKIKVNSFSTVARA
jgi:hypothetical protein